MPSHLNNEALLLPNVHSNSTREDLQRHLCKGEPERRPALIGEYDMVLSYRLHSANLNIFLNHKIHWKQSAIIITI